MFREGRGLEAISIQNEQIVLAYWLYSPYVPVGVRVDDDPPLTGFWVEVALIPTEAENDER
jgi:hypothetical protein